MHKKILLSLFVFSFLTVGVFQAEASVLGDLINQINSLRSRMTASVIDLATGVSIPGTPTTDLTPRIMYWSGKVNQHVDLKTGQWETDPDGKSGADIDKLTYCKKWYPNTVSVEDYQNETIYTWRAAGNTGEYTSIKMSTKCVQPSVGSYSISSITGQKTEYTSNSDISISVQGTETVDGSYTTGQERFHVQAYVYKDLGYINEGIDYLPPNPSDSYNGVYDSNSNTWKVNMKAPSESGSYYLNVALYCSSGNAYCTKYSSSPESIKRLYFKVPSVVVAPICKDSDGGKDYYVKGNISGLSSTSLGVRTLGIDTCYTPSSSGSGGTTGTIGTYLLETYCASSSQMSEEEYKCSNGCNNGACIYTTTTPSITVLSPNGGETFTQKTDNKINFSYKSPDLQFVQIALVDPNMTNNSNTSLIKGWISAPGGPGGPMPFSGSFNWGATRICDLGFLSCWSVIPGQYKILVQIKDSMGNLSMLPSAKNWDVSDQVFTIKSLATPTPSITVLSPNGGNTYTAGEQIKIEWKALNVPDDSVATIALVDKTGNNYYLNSNMMCTSTSPCINIHNGYYTTTIPKTLSSGQYKARVICNVSGSDRACVDSNWEDLSDNYFTILPTTSPTITVLSPSAGDSFTAGQTITVKWETQNVPSTFKLGIIRLRNYSNTTNTGNEYDLTTNNTTLNDGQEILVIPSNIPSGHYKLEIKSYLSADAPFFDDSEYFTISSKTNPLITTVYPRGGETYTAGQQITVKWSSLGLSPSELVNIYLYSPSQGFDLSLATNTVNDGTQIVTLPNVLTKYGNLFKIKIGQFSTNASMGVSEDYFTITSSVATCANGATNFPDCTLISTPSLKVTYPNGGEVFNGGQKITVKWESPNISPNELVNIYLNIPEDKWSLVLATRTVNDGQEDFILSDTLSKYGKIYKIIVSPATVSVVQDSSDNLFTINKASIIPINNDIGCPAGAVYSSTTGQLCPNTGCSKGEIYSSTTGAVCLKNGCPAGSIYSMTTGQLCLSNTVSCPLGYIYDPYTGKPCSSIPSYSSSSLLPQCSDRKDNDTDGTIDRNDNQCHFGASLFKAYINNFDSESSDELSRIRVLKLTNPMMTGEDIKALQENLGLIPADGVYGYNTYNAVKSWQTKNGLWADGIFGPACYNQMYLELFKLKNSL